MAVSRSEVLPRTGDWSVVVYAPERRRLATVTARPFRAPASEWARIGPVPAFENGCRWAGERFKFNVFGSAFDSWRTNRSRLNARSPGSLRRNPTAAYTRRRLGNGPSGCPLARFEAWLAKLPRNVGLLRSAGPRPWRRRCAMKCHWKTSKSSPLRRDGQQRGAARPLGQNRGSNSRARKGRLAHRRRAMQQHRHRFAEIPFAGP